MDFLEDLWILLLLPSLLLPLALQPHTATFSGTQKTSQMVKGDLQNDKLSDWGPMGAVKPSYEKMIVWRNQGN